MLVKNVSFLIPKETEFPYRDICLVLMFSAYLSMTISHGFLFVFGHQEPDIVGKVLKTIGSPIATCSTPLICKNTIRTCKYKATLQPFSNFRIQPWLHGSNSTTDQFYYLADSNGVFDNTPVNK